MESISLEKNYPSDRAPPRQLLTHILGRGRVLAIQAPSPGSWPCRASAPGADPLAWHQRCPANSWGAQRSIQPADSFMPGRATQPTARRYDADS